jgi:hypothetical protein
MRVTMGLGVSNETRGLETPCTKMGTDSLAGNTTNAPEFICSIGLSAKAQNFWISKKMASSGVPSPFVVWSPRLSF